MKTARWRELPAKALLQLADKPLQTMAVDGVFKTCVLAVTAIAMITLQAENLFAHLNHLVRFAG